MNTHEGPPNIAVLDTLLAFPLLTAMEYEGQYAMQSKSRFIDYEAAETIIGFGDKMADVFFILRGGVQVSIRSATGSKVPLGTLATGQYFGELAAVDHRPQLALIETLEPTLIAASPAAVFCEAVMGSPNAVRQLLKDLANVLRTTEARIGAARADSSKALRGVVTETVLATGGPEKPSLVMQPLQQTAS